MVVERATIGVRDGDGLRRQLDSVERRAIAAVGDVDQHPDFVHRLDDLGAEIADASIHPLGAAAADEVLAVVRELRTTLPEQVEALHIRRRPEVLCVLNAHDHRDLALRLRTIEIGRSADERKYVCVAPHESLPSSQERERVFDDPGTAGADRVMKPSDAAAAERRLVRLAQQPGVGLGPKVDLERGQHVDDERALDDAHDARGVAFVRRGENTETADVDHRRPDADRAHDGALQQCSAHTVGPLDLRHHALLVAVRMRPASPPPHTLDAHWMLPPS